MPSRRDGRSSLAYPCWLVKAECRLEGEYRTPWGCKYQRYLHPFVGSLHGLHWALKKKIGKSWESVPHGIRFGEEKQQLLQERHKTCGVPSLHETKALNCCGESNTSPLATLIKTCSNWGKAAEKNSTSGARSEYHWCSNNVGWGCGGVGIDTVQWKFQV